MVPLSFFDNAKLLETFLLSYEHIGASNIFPTFWWRNFFTAIYAFHPISTNVFQIPL